MMERKEEREMPVAAGMGWGSFYLGCVSGGGGLEY